MGFRSGFVPILGQPNVGKSTLLNRLVGEKIAIVTPKPQTTRNRILGILTTSGFQAVFVDTPGLIQPRYPLQEYMAKAARKAAREGDLILYMVDVRDEPRGEGFKDLRIPTILVINKVDLLKDKGALLPLFDEYRRQGEFRELIPISALTGDGVVELLKLIENHLPLGPAFYPADKLTESSERFIASELIREKVFLLLKQEIPYGTAVKVEEYKEKADTLYIRAIIFVEKRSQKGILIGQGGGMLKRLGQLSRLELEELLGKRVYLDLWVKVREKWRKRREDLRYLGYGTI
jgi:GTP-binding protein Era